GHFFPSGTIDAQEVWLEFQAEDATGRPFFWSGFTGEAGEADDAPVDGSAHFFRSLLLDAHGNPINKRNAWSARSVLYVSPIPPGAAHTVRYRLQVPEDIEGPVTLTARLNYRKFDWWHTQWTFRGQLEEGGEVASAYDDRAVRFADDLAAPDVPIVEMATGSVRLPVAGEASPPTEAVPGDLARALRFNDYGIGMLLAGDLRAAESAFSTVARLAPEFADAPVNLARVRLQEGDPEGAREAAEAALRLAPNLPRALFFRAMAMKALGRYDEALADLNAVQEVFPRDRVVNNQVGRLLFLNRDFAEAVAVLEKTLAIDPEDLEAHYNLMLASQGLRDPERAARHRELYLRFKADEASQFVTGDYRRTHPDDNNERLPIHEHRNGLAER
ncbi:MAG: tetratricopeptide repeat protein, partial [Acidobacteriota bacterium]|nr:tetratricopeptide repeat protein [Acidobacteriota bacterium]